MGKFARAKLPRLAAESHGYAAFQHIKKTLPMRRSQRAPGFELGGVLGEGGSDGRRRVHNNGYRIEAGQRHADEGIRRLQQVGGLAIAAGVSEVIHSVPYLLTVSHEAQESHARRPAHSPHPGDEPTPRDDG